MPSTTSPGSVDLVSRILNARPVFFLLFILFFTALSYSNTLFSPLILDDTHSFVENSDVYLDDFSLESLIKLSHTTFGTRRFLPMLSFAINHKFSHGKIHHYHLTNIAIHLLTGVAIFFFTLRLTGMSNSLSRFLRPSLMAFTVSGLWALNPIQTNAVTYLVQRMTSIAALFYITSLCFYIYGRTSTSSRDKWLFLCLSGICAFASFYSKENSATLPFAVLMTEAFFISPGITGRILSGIKPWQWLLLAVLTLLLAPPVLAGFGQLTNYSSRSFDLTERVLTQARVVIWYISLLLLPLPSRMSLEHDIPISLGLFAPFSTALSIVAIAVLLLCAWKIRRETPLISFGVFWYFLNLLIESSIFPLELVFEHRLYLPSMGIFIAVAGALDLGGHYLKNRLPSPDIEKGIFLLLVSLLCLSSLLTTLRNDDWCTELSIYRDCAVKSPNKPRAISELGLALAKSGDYEGGIKYSREAILKGRPFQEVYCTAATNVVLSLSKSGQKQEAIRQGEEYLENIPEKADQGSLWTLLYNLANLYREENQPVKAFYAIKKALLYRSTASNQVAILMAMNIVDTAFDNPEARKTLDLQGDNRRMATLLKMTELMIQVRDYDQAGVFLNMGLNEFPGDASVEKIKTALSQVTEKNQASVFASEIANHKPFSENDYKSTWLCINFIFKYYQPLAPLAGHLIERIKKIYPRDPFLTLIDLKYKRKFTNQPLSTEEIEAALADHPDFIPLISLAMDVYLAKGDKENAIGMITRLLTLYPGIGSWRSLLFTKSTLQDGLNSTAGSTNKRSPLSNTLK